MLRPSNSQHPDDEPNKKIKTESLIVCSPKKKGFLGFLVNVLSYTRLYEQYIQTGLLKYLLTYKTSQYLVAKFGK
jgi:hypothetical protein